MSLDEETRKKINQIEKEISIIKGILLLSNFELIEKNLEIIFTTNDRKLMWILLDGKKTQDEIAKEVGKTQAAVSYFISLGKELGLINDNEGQAKRAIEVIPKEWLVLKKKK